MNSRRPFEQMDMQIQLVYSSHCPVPVAKSISQENNFRTTGHAGRCSGALAAIHNKEEIHLDKTLAEIPVINTVQTTQCHKIYRCNLYL